MNKTLLMAGAAIALALATPAFAQSSTGGCVTAPKMAQAGGSEAPKLAQAGGSEAPKLAQAGGSEAPKLASATPCN